MLAGKSHGPKLLDKNVKRLMNIVLRSGQTRWDKNKINKKKKKKKGKRKKKK